MKKMKKLFTLALAVLFILALLAPAALAEPFDPLEVHANAIVVDTHNDSMARVLNSSTWLPVNDPGQGISNAQLDFVKMAEGGLDVGFFAAYTSGYTQEGRANSRALALNNALHWSAGLNPDTFGIATSVAEIEALAAEGKSIGVATVEGAYFLEEYNAIELLRQYYDLGNRAISLCWSNSNSLGAGVNMAYPGGAPSPDGITELGKEVILEMVRLGIIIDVSHLSDQTFWDIVELTDAPIMATHSATRTVYDANRNLTDEMLVAIKESEGVAQINFYAPTLGPAGNRGVKELVDHIDHVVDLIGVDYVGLGSDFDGGSMPTEVPNASYYYRVTEELAARDYTEEDIVKILGGNALRVMATVEEMADAPPAVAQDITITPAFEMGDPIGSWTPRLSAKVDGDAESYRIIVDGIVYTPTFNANTGTMSVRITEPLIEKFHVATFEATNSNGEIARETRIFYIEEDPDYDKAIVELSGPETINKRSDAEYLLSVGNFEDLGNMTVTFEVEDKYFVGKDFSGLNGLDQLGQTKWTKLDNDIWEGQVTLWSPTGIYSEDLLDLFKMAFTAKDETGDTSLTITGLVMTCYNSGTSQFIDYKYEGGVNSLPIKIGIRFDINGDGVLDQRDLTDAQYYYQAKVGDANWEQAKRADVNGDGVVDAEDFILILANITF